MTSHIDDLLARARLRREPCTRADVDAAAARLAARTTMSRDTTAPASLGDEPPDARCAADDLQTLCETVITHTDALADLELFLARALPEPPGARVLGCKIGRAHV